MVSGINQKNIKMVSDGNQNELNAVRKVSDDVSKVFGFVRKMSKGVRKVMIGCWKSGIWCQKGVKKAPEESLEVKKFKIGIICCQYCVIWCHEGVRSCQEGVIWCQGGVI